MGLGCWNSFYVILIADSEEVKALAVSNAEAAFKSHQHRVSYFDALNKI